MNTFSSALRLIIPHQSCLQAVNGSVGSSATPATGPGRLMKGMVHRYILVSAIIALLGCSPLMERRPSGAGSIADNYLATRSYYTSLIEGRAPRIAELTLFFSQMPKGGDIHHHYSGSLYAETYLDWVEMKGYRIHRGDFTIDMKQAEGSISVSELRKDNLLYRELLKRWSDKDYRNHFHLQPPPDAQFFDTFGYFGPISAEYFNEGLRELKTRALRENVQYIETMFKSAGYSREDERFDREVGLLRSGTDEAGLEKAFGAYMSVIEGDRKFSITVAEFLDLVRAGHSGIDDDRFIMRFQSYVSRNYRPSAVFSGLAAAFKAAEQSDLIVGVNLVGPENGLTAMADFQLQMQMFRFMRARFPKVHIAMHAGELALGMVPPEGLTSHIRDSIEIAGAERIGHGVDIAYEPSAPELLQKMRDKHIAVEINLTSNEFILGVKDESHPVTIYNRFGVPVVLSSDDSGVSRNTLTSEYVLLASRYRFSYDDIKKAVYNSIEYSFMSTQDKEKNKKILDARYLKFEADMAKFEETINSRKSPGAFSTPQNQQ